MFALLWNAEMSSSDGSRNHDFFIPYGTPTSLAGQLRKFVFLPCYATDACIWILPFAKLAGLPSRGVLCVVWSWRMVRAVSKCIDLRWCWWEKADMTMGSVKLNPLPASSFEMGGCQNTAQHPNQ